MDTSRTGQSSPPPKTARPRARRRWSLLDTLGLVVVLALFVFVFAPFFISQTQQRQAEIRPQLRVKADVDAVSSAIKRYQAHCGGLPVGGETGTTNCTVEVNASGPTALPDVLKREQTNAQGQVSGPFIAAFPALPPAWVGVGNSYAYYTMPGNGFSRFVVCGSGAGVAANSNDGRTCP